MPTCRPIWVGLGWFKEQTGQFPGLFPPRPENKSFVLFGINRVARALAVESPNNSRRSMDDHEINRYMVFVGLVFSGADKNADALKIIRKADEP
jgi:hypothetical protein